MSAYPSRILEDSDALPPKPQAPEGRAVLWVYVLGAPGFSYHGTHHKVTGQTIDEHVARFNLMSARGYDAPLAALHPKEIHPRTSKGAGIASPLAQLLALPKELRKGDILKVCRHEVDGQPALIAAVSPAMAEADCLDAVKLGRIKYFSPGIGPVELDSGDILTDVLKELSIVPAPHQKTGGSHILGSEVDPSNQEETMDPKEEKGAEPEGKDLEARMGDLESTVTTLAESVTTMMDSVKKLMEPGEKEEEPVEMAEVSPALKAMQAKVAELEAAKEDAERREFNATLPAGHTLTLGEDDADWLYELSKSHAEKFKGLRSRLAKPATETITMGEGPWGPIGNSSTPELKAPALKDLSDEDFEKQFRAGKLG